jgi:hypothetical protein
LALALPWRIESESVCDQKGADSSEQVAAEDIDDYVIPPALLEVIQHIAQGVLDQFESHWGEEE